MSFNNSLKTVFIVGHPRSGSTWTMWLLGRHPEVLAGNHLGVFHALEPFVSWWRKPAVFGKRVHIFDQPTDKEGGIRSLPDFLDEEFLVEQIRPVLHNLFTKISAEDSGAQVLIDQTPENMEFWPLITELLPEAYFIHIHRDPRSVLASMRSAVKDWADPFGFPTHPIEAARAWNAYQDQGAALAKSHKKVFLLKYEDLLSDGVPILQKLFAWLELKASPELCAAILEASTVEKLKSNKGLMPSGFFRTGKSCSWTGELSPSSIQIVDLICRDWMKAYGYESAGSIGRLVSLRVRIYDRISAVFLRYAPRRTRQLYRLIQRIPILRYHIYPPGKEMRKIR